MLESKDFVPVSGEGTFVAIRPLDTIACKQLIIEMTGLLESWGELFGSRSPADNGHGTVIREMKQQIHELAIAILAKAKDCNDEVAATVSVVPTKRRPDQKWELIYRLREVGRFGWILSTRAMEHFAWSDASLKWQDLQVEDIAKQAWIECRAGLRAANSVLELPAWQVGLDMRFATVESGKLFEREACDFKLMGATFMDAAMFLNDENVDAARKTNKAWSADKKTKIDVLYIGLCADGRTKLANVEIIAERVSETEKLEESRKRSLKDFLDTKKRIARAEKSCADNAQTCAEA